MRSSRYASLTRLLIGASIIVGLFGTTASVALAASPATFGLLRQEDPHNGVQTTDTVYLSTDTVTATGDITTGITVNLSSASPAHTASLAITAPTVSPFGIGTYSSVDTTPTTDKPGVVLTVDGSACAPTTKLGKLTISQLHFTGTDVDGLNLMWEGFCPTLEIHLQVGIAATGDVHVVATNPANTKDVGGVNVGATSATNTITYTNIGNAAVDMSSLAKGGRYPELYTFAKTCGATLAVGASCNATMVFKPVTYGLREGAVTLTGDDISADGLHKEVLVTGTGLVIDAPNDTPAHAINVTPIPTSTTPFYSGVQLQNLDPSHGNCDTDDNAAVWYHINAGTSAKTFDLTTTDSDVATNIELYTGPVGAPVFVQCGVNIDVNLRDKLTFTANANTDYYVRVAREVPPPGDYAIVLKVSLGSPDTMVDVSGFATNYGTFYPVVDGYRDSVNISANRGETASASISIYNPSGTRVRILTVPSGTGAYSVAWNGKNTAGTLQGNGKYKIISTVTDTNGNHLSDTRYVTLSTKKLISKTFTQTIDGAKYTTLLKTGTGSASKTSTAYTGGLKMTSGSNGTVAAVYSFTAPSAISYSTVTFTAIGKYTTNTMTIGLQNWTVCTTYSVSCVTATHGGPHSSGITSASVSSPASTGLATAIRRVRGYIFAPALPGTVRTLDVRDVKVTVTYKVLG